MSPVERRVFDEIAASGVVLEHGDRIVVKCRRHASPIVANTCDSGCSAIGYRCGFFRRFRSFSANPGIFGVDEAADGAEVEQARH